MERMTEKRTLRTAASLVGVGVLLAAAPYFGMASASADTTAPATPSASAGGSAHSPKTPIQHFVFLTQENHTFDNYFGTRPGVDGIPPNVCMPVHQGQPTPCVKPYHVTNQGSTDLEHTSKTFDQQYDNGKMDGFVSLYTAHGLDGSPTMAYYDATDIPYYWNIADNYVLFDHFFSSARDGSPSNHMFEVTATNGYPLGSADIPAGGWGDLPTIFDRLQAAGVSWKFYVQNYDPSITFRTPNINDQSAQVVWVPLLGYARYIDNPALMSHIVDLSQYYKDAASGNLPDVSYIEPSGDSEHPPGRVQSGETLVRSLVTTLMKSSSWSTSAFLWTYDDWGGFYDHVKPPQVDQYGYGFRVPTLLVGPYVKKDYVDHTVCDFTSVLKFIEYNWSLQPLASRDAKANDFLDAFDFSSPARPPVVIGTSLSSPPVTHPRTSGVYTTFAAAGGGVLLLAVIAIVFGRRRGPKKTAPEPVHSPSGLAR